jgi:Na+-transporting methylmalonyl-CoA/oxaloacetate decarboxylase gamma subunit
VQPTQVRGGAVVIDWSKAVSVSAIGLANVFVVLAILGLAVYAVGRVVQRMEKK